MQDLQNIIKTRRSIRRFQDKPVPPGLLDELMTAAKWSPSWANSQCWELIIIDAPTQKALLTSTLADRNPAALAVANAPVIIALCAQLGKSGYYREKPSTDYQDWFMYDLGLLTQNICLTAHALGLGTVIVGAFDHRTAQVHLGLPENFAVLALLPVGYPAHSPSPPPRREISDFTHRNYFSRVGSRQK